jgi:hypothetical protein
MKSWLYNPSEGEQGLRNFIKKKKDKIPDRLIVYFAVTAINQGREEYAVISEILAEKKIKKRFGIFLLKYRRPLLHVRS